MVHVEELSYKTKNIPLLRDINLDIQPGEFIAVVGPNGAGKSTFLSCIASELAYQAKSYSFKGKDIKSYPNTEIPLHRAKFSQHHSSEINLKNDEIVLMGRYPYFGNEANQSDLEIVSKWMQKTETSHLINREYEQLSGGEKQRIHLARIFAQLDNDIDNKLMLLDEPLNNLDVAHQFKTLHLIKEFTAKQHSALVVLHDLNIAAQFADRLILLDKGAVEIIDAPRMVLTEERISRVYQYPCSITNHPITNQSIILFG